MSEWPKKRYYARAARGLVMQVRRKCADPLALSRHAPALLRSRVLGVRARASASFRNRTFLDPFLSPSPHALTDSFSFLGVHLPVLVPVFFLHAVRASMFNFLNP